MEVVKLRKRELILIVVGLDKTFRCANMENESARVPACRFVLAALGPSSVE